MAMINGAADSSADGMTLSDYLDSKGYLPVRIAVELNGEIADKKSYGSITIAFSDVIEIVSFVGGG